MIAGAVLEVNTGPTASILRGQRISGAGTVQWGADGVLVSVFSGAIDPVGGGVLGDGSGGAYFVWARDFGSGTGGGVGPYIAYGRRLNGAGFPITGFGVGTPPNSAALLGALADGQTDVSEVRPLPDGAGGLILVAACSDWWQAENTLSVTPAGVISLNHATSSGLHDWSRASETPSWENRADGLSSALFLRVVADGSGGAIIAYTHGGHIYAAKVNNSGVTTSVDPVNISGLGPELLVMPNPTRGTIRVSFTLRERASAQLELFDITGRRILTLDEGTSAKGPHNVEVAPRERLTGRLRNAHHQRRDKSLGA